MKNLFLSCILSTLFAQLVQAQSQVNAADLSVFPGTYFISLNGIVNTNGGTITIDGTLRTPGDLSNSAGATLQGDGEYHIGGDWTNSATFNAGLSTVTFEGDQNSTVTSGSDAFYSIQLNKLAADLLPADNMNITNTLDFQASENYVVLTDFNLQAGAILGYEASRHVRTTGTGFLIRTVGASPVVFPVGNTGYNPATLTNAGASDQYHVRVAENVLNGGYSGSAYLTDAVDRSWFVEEATPGGSDLTLDLQWNGSEELAGFDRTVAYVSHFDGGSWDDQATSAATGADPYSLSRTGITALSPFAVLGANFQPTIDILGQILWKGDGFTGVQDATVHASGDLNGITSTDVNGNYSLSLAGNGNVSIAPTKTINLLNGVNVGDALAIQQHLVGINPISDPYAWIAMDVNRDDKISTFDAVLIRQALLGNPQALKIFNKSWRFVPQAYSLALPPWGFPEQIDLTGVVSNQTDQDFYGVKIGDVIATYANPANFGAGMAPLVLHVQDQNLEAGQDLEVSFSADYLQDVAAWQFGLQFNPQYLDLQAVEPLTALPLNADNFSLSDDAIRAVWTFPGGAELEEGSTLFRLRFKALASGVRLSDVLSLESSILPGVVFDRNLQQAPVALQFNQTTSTGALADVVQLFENWPNPFIDKTTIAFMLPPGGCDVLLRIYDTAGRELWRTNKYYPGGYHKEQVQLGTTTASGGLFYELTTPFGTQAKPMVKTSR
ncbi:MAG: hypothetical protein H6569_12910 [Lewinellaceae bacterium]|nr:hypothetical protein [Lewinellaceae bacterium]